MTATETEKPVTFNGRPAPAPGKTSPIPERLTPDPPAPPIPALEVVAFGGLLAMAMPPWPYEPGDAGIAKHGGLDVEKQPVSGFILRFPINDARSLIGLARETTDDVTARLSAVREGFRSHPLLATWKRAAEELAALKAREPELKTAPAKAEATLASIVATGKGDVAVAEAAYLEADRELRLFGPRVRGLAEGELRARAAAQNELAKLVDAERQSIHAEAAAVAKKLGDEILAFIRERVEQLLVANRTAGESHEDTRVAGWWKRDVFGTFAASLPAVPDAPEKSAPPYPRHAGEFGFGCSEQQLTGSR